MAGADDESGQGEREQEQEEREQEEREQEEREHGDGETPEDEAMVEYFVVLLTKGPAWTGERTPETETLHEAHLANVERLYEQGALLMAGPVADHAEEGRTGLFLLEADSLAAARDLVESDPAVEAGRFEAEVLSLYQPAGYLDSLGDG